MRGPQEHPNFYRSAARLGLAALAVPGAMLVDRLVQASPDLQTPSTVSTGITVRLPNRGPSQTESSLAPYGLEVRRNSGTIFAQTVETVTGSASVDPQFEGGEVADNDETVFRSQNLMVAEAVGPNTYNFTDALGRSQAWTPDNMAYSSSQGQISGALERKIDGADVPVIRLKESFHNPNAAAYIVAMVYDVESGKGYVIVVKDTPAIDGTSAFDNGEIIADATDNPTDMNGRTVLEVSGLEGITILNEAFSSFELKKESDRKYLELNISNAVDVAKRGVYRKFLDTAGWTKVDQATPTPTAVLPTATPTPKTIECGQAFLQDPPFGPLEASGAKQAAKNMGKGLPSGLTPQQEQALNVAPVGNPDNILNNLDVTAIKNEGKRKKKMEKAKPPQAYSPLANVCAPVTRPARPGARPAGVEATATPSATRQAQIDNKRVSPTATPTRKAS